MKTIDDYHPTNRSLAELHVNFRDKMIKAIEDRRRQMNWDEKKPGVISERVDRKLNASYRRACYRVKRKTVYGLRLAGTSFAAMNAFMVTNLFVHNHQNETTGPMILITGLATLTSFAISELGIRRGYKNVYRRQFKTVQGEKVPDPTAIGHELVYEFAKDYVTRDPEHRGHGMLARLRRRFFAPLPE